MIIEKITGAAWANAEHTVIDCLVKFDAFPEALPYTAMKTDVVENGRKIFQMCVDGEAGDIQEYAMSAQDQLKKIRFFKVEEINLWRDRMESASYVFEFNGRRWDYGKETQARLEPSVAAARAGKLPEGFFWTDADNNDVPMTAEALIALSEAAQQAMFAKGLEIHLRQREMKKAVEALNDADAVLAYRVGWE